MYTLSSSNFCRIFSLALFSSSFSAFRKANILCEHNTYFILLKNESNEEKENFLTYNCRLEHKYEIWQKDH